MRKSLLLQVFLGIALFVQAQSTTPPPAPEFSNFTHISGRYSLGSTGPDETVRQKFIDQQWSLGTVLFSNSPIRYTAPMIFDEFQNKLYFYKDEHILEFVQPVKEFTLSLRINGDSTIVLFRNSYPTIHKNTGQTFYQVLVDGNYQLLKCSAKTINLYKDQEIPEQQREPLNYKLFAYFPDSTIIEVNPDKEYLLMEIPGHSEIIKKTLAQNKLKLKKEKHLLKLFRLLNEKSGQ